MPCATLAWSRACFDPEFEKATGEMPLAILMMRDNDDAPRRRTFLRDWSHD